MFDVVVGGNSPSSATPATVQAVQKVRDFLDDQTAELVVDRVQESAGLVFVNLSRSAPAMEDQPQYANQFFVEVAENSIFAADLNSNTLPVQPWHSVDKREARAIAEDFFEQKNVDFGEFTLVSSETLQLNDYLLNVTWAIEDDGVWLPTTVEVGVSLQTGLVVRYIDRDYPYDGPREAEIPESAARDTAEQIIAINPTLEGASIESVRLAVTFSNFVEDTVDGQVIIDMEAHWRLAWEFGLSNVPSPDSDHFIWIDAMTGERLTTGQ
ncbi:MAG: hypothetical protein R3A46_16200 [Thermomicrobiales bacterium]